MGRWKVKQYIHKSISLALATAMIVTSVPDSTALANTGSAMDIGHPIFKNTDLLDSVYNLEADDYTATESQLMKIYNEDVANGSESFYIDRILARTGVANGNAETGGNDDGNSFMTRGRALYMNTSDPAVIGFGGNTAYCQPIGNGDLYEVTFSDGTASLPTTEDTTKRVNMPSHWVGSYAVGSTGLTASVKKFINYQNVAVTLVTLTNSGAANKDITVNVASNFAKTPVLASASGSAITELTGSLKSPSNLTTITPRLYAATSSESFNIQETKLQKTVTVPAGSSIDFKVIMSFTTTEIPESTEEYIRFIGLKNTAAIKAQKEEYNKKWAETMPYIDMPNKAIQKAIDYRWWLESFNTLDANIPGYDYQYPITIEGVLGYNNAIALTQPMHLQDTKWMRDASLAYGQLLSVGNSSQSSAFLDNPGNRSNWNNHYGQYIATAGLEAFEVIGGNSELAENLAYYFENDAKGQLEHYGNHTSATTPANYLIDYRNAYMTGNDADTISFAYSGSGTWKTHAENAYVYGAADAAAKLYQMIGNTAKASENSTLASNIQSDILSLLWCDQDNAFETRAVSPSSSFVVHNTSKPNLIPLMENNNFNYFSEGVVPTDAASIAKYKKMFQYFTYADEFPIFPYYTANQVDNKTQAGSNNFSNINFTVQARAYEAALRTYDKEQEYITDDMLALMTEWCAWNMYPNGGDIRYPNNNEFFNMDGKTNDTYYRSWIYHNILGNYNYIFVEDVAGIVPREDDLLELDPIDFDYDHFMINNVRYHGQDVTVVWDDPSDTTDYYSNIADGYSLYIDGKVAFVMNQKTHVIYDSETGTVTYPDGTPTASGFKCTVSSVGTVVKAATEVGFTDTNVINMLKKSGIEVNITSGNLAEGATVTASYTPSQARAATWASKHRADGTDATSTAVNEEKPDPQAITDGTTVNMPFWGNDASTNQSDSVEIQLSGEKTFDMMNIYFYNDRQSEGYAEPAKYTLEYWDKGTSSWKHADNQSRTPSIPQANYNVDLFTPVTTDKVRITVYNQENHYTAISEVQLYSEGGTREIVKNTAPTVTLSEDTTTAYNLKAKVVAICEDDGRPWDGKLTYLWEVVEKPEGAAAIFGNNTALETTLSGSVAGTYKLRFKASDGDLETEKEITVVLTEEAVVGSADIAVNATPAASSTASWENLNGINNAAFEPTTSNGGTNKGWGNWASGQAAGLACWVSYTWDSAVEISGCDIYWYDDAGGTRVPASISFQYKDSSGNWQNATMLTDYANAKAINKYNTIALSPVKTTALRLNMVTQAAATGIYRFKVYGPSIKELLPVYVATKTGTIPQLPAEIYAKKQDGTLTKASVVWDEITSEQVSNSGEFTVNGVNASSGKFVTAHITVRSDMNLAQITSVDSTTVQTVLGVEPVLPDVVKVGYNNGASDNVNVNVTWDGFSMDQIASIGTHTLENVGTVTGTSIKATLVVDVTADFTALNLAVASGQALKAEEYTPASWSAMQAALSVAMTAPQNAKSQNEINTVATNLLNAINALVLLHVTADMTKLNTLIVTAEDITKDKYTESTRSAFETALATAKALVATAPEDQTGVDNMVTLLKEAIAALQKNTTAAHSLYLTFDKQTNATAIDDVSDSNFDAVAAGLTDANWVEGIGGVSGGALQFTGTSSFEIPAQEKLATSNITISYWIKRTAELTGDNNILWAKNASTYNGNGFYINNPVGDGYSTFFVMDGFNGFYVNQNPNEFFEENQWTHVAITWDSDAKVGHIYKNGVDQNIELNGTPASITGSSLAVNRIGENGYPGSGYPVGMTMDELEIYNDSLSSSQIKALYNKYVTPTPTATPTPIPTAAHSLHLSFDKQADVTSIDDISSNNFDAVAAGLTEDNWVQGVSGVSGTALQLTATSSFEIPAKEKLATPDITISYWIKRTAELAGDNNLIWAKNASTYNGNGFYINNPVSEGYSTYFVMDGFNGFYVNQNPNEFFEANKWTHVAITWDSDAKTGHIYKNGVDQIIELNGTPASITGSALAVNRIGENGYPGSGYPVGLTIDELEIYSDSLSSTQINELYSKYVTPIPTTAPTAAPTAIPTAIPTAAPTPTPSYNPPSSVPTAIPTPTTVPTATPIPTPVQHDETVAGDKSGASVNISTTVANGKVEAVVQVKTDAIKEQMEEATKDKPLQVDIPIASDYITEQLKDKDNTDGKITVKIPNELLNKDNVDTNIKLSSDILEAAKELNKNVTVSAENEEGKMMYSWTFEGSSLTSSDNEVKDVNISLSVSKIDDKSELGELLNTKDSKNESATGIVIDFSHNDVLPGQAQVKIYVGDLIGDITANSKVYLYYYNSETDKLDTLPYSSGYAVDKDGYIAINLVHCSEYVLLPEKADDSISSSLLNQITAKTNKKTIYLKNEKKSKASVLVTLPGTLEQVSSFEEETSGSAIGAVTITYRTSNKKIATVNSKGVVKAKGKGKVTITTKITLYSGKTKSYKSVVTVK